MDELQDFFNAVSHHVSCQHGHLVSTGLVMKPVGRTVLARLSGSLLASRLVSQFNQDRREMVSVRTEQVACVVSSRQFYFEVKRLVRRLFPERMKSSKNLATTCNFEGLR